MKAKVRRRKVKVVVVYTHVNIIMSCAAIDDIDFGSAIVMGKV